MEKIIDNYSYFYNEMGDYTIVFGQDTDKEEPMAICADEDQAKFIVERLNNYDKIGEIVSSSDTHKEGWLGILKIIKNPINKPNQPFLPEERTPPEHWYYE
jgi:hypothetical protein